MPGVRGGRGAKLRRSMPSATASKNRRIARPAMHAEGRHALCFIFWCAASQQGHRASEAAEAAEAPRKGRASPRPAAPPVALPGAPGAHRRRRTGPERTPSEPRARLQRNQDGRPSTSTITRKPRPTERTRPQPAPARPAAWLHRPDLATWWLHGPGKQKGQPRRIGLSA